MVCILCPACIYALDTLYTIHGNCMLQFQKLFLFSFISFSGKVRFLKMKTSGFQYYNHCYHFIFWVILKGQRIHSPITLLLQQWRLLSMSERKPQDSLSFTLSMSKATVDTACGKFDCQCLSRTLKMHCPYAQ